MWYWGLRALFLCVFKLFFRFTVSGKGNIPRKTNIIVVGNHTSFLDPLLIMAAVPAKIYCIAARYLYKFPLLKWFFHKTGAFPSGSSSDKAVSLLLEGKNVGLFPEGKCSRDGSMGRFRRGVALLAVKTGRPVVPCAIKGAYAALPWQRRFPRPVPIRVTIGEPIFFLKEFHDVINDIDMQEGLVKIRTAIKEMLDA